MIDYTIIKKFVFWDEEVQSLIIFKQKLRNVYSLFLHNIKKQKKTKNKKV